MQSRYLALILLIVCIKLYTDHTAQGAQSLYKDDGSYENITPMKHDLFKQLTLDLFPLLVYGIATDDVFYNPNNILDSIVGKIGVGLASYVVYYQLVEPYYVNRVRKF